MTIKQALELLIAKSVCHDATGQLRCAEHCPFEIGCCLDKWRNGAMVKATQKMIAFNKALAEDNVDFGYLCDWFIHSVGDEQPVWTEEHIDELLDGFIVIPKEEEKQK